MHSLTITYIYIHKEKKIHTGTHKQINKYTYSNIIQQRNKTIIY